MLLTRRRPKTDDPEFPPHEQGPNSQNGHGVLCSDIGKEEWRASWRAPPTANGPT